MNTIGNMNVRTLNFDEIVCKTPDLIQLGSNPYHYQMLTLSEHQNFDLDGTTKKAAIILLEGNILINNIELNIDELYFSDVSKISINAIHDSRLLIAYMNLEKIDFKGKILKLDEIKKVDKPWGYEIWYTGDPSILFAFKKIFIKKGNKTSLQVHKVKRETNFIVRGSAKLHYVENHKYEPNKKYEILSIPLKSPVVIDVFPYTIHRVEALTDLLLYEVSTPELDDVIRLEDDTNRDSGRINEEH